jgi:thioredoxin
MAIVHLTDNSFAAAIATGTVLVDFWADWCGPCKMLAPTIEELAAEFDGLVTVGKLDTDANGQTAMAYGISAIPTVIVFKNGEEFTRIIGVHPKEDYAAALA